MGCSCLFGIALVYERPILLFRLAALRPYIDEYLRQHVEHLEALELSDWDALKVAYEVLGLAREMRERLGVEYIPTGP